MDLQSATMSLRRELKGISIHAQSANLASARRAEEHNLVSAQRAEEHLYTLAVC
jgi:hypothetical protein